MPDSLRLTEPVWGPEGRLLDGAPLPGNGQLDAYRPAFADAAAPFLTYHALDGHKRFVARTFTRGEFWLMAQRAAGVLAAHGLGAGDAFVLAVGSNRWEDLAFRLAAVMTGAVPVTINWQADDLDRVVYKTTVTGARLVLTDSTFDPALRDGLRARLPDSACFDLAGLEAAPPRPDAACRPPPAAPETATRIVIFTSGTTGNPKGVALSYRSYAVNRLTFEDFLGRPPGAPLTAVLVNPLHHTNSTAISDWLLRRPGARLHLLERYSTDYWRVLADVGRATPDYVLAPLVSRHIDFLDSLARGGQLPLPEEELRAALRPVRLLLGSAPVGPTTVQRVRHFTGRLPVVRFGSTETCLQVIGTLARLPKDAQLAACEAGWAHTWRGEALAGYYLGRDHYPCNRVAVVRSADAASPDYLVPCAPGEPGLIVTRGGNLMQGYLGDPVRTAAVLRDGWYFGLEDLGFWLPSPHDGGPDLYWVNRVSALLIRGGANYSYDQINEELTRLLATTAGVDTHDVTVAVVGLRVESEHEDSCCVTVELRGAAAAASERVASTFLAAARKQASKGAKPDFLRLAAVPRNFKGAVLVPELRAGFFAGDAPVYAPAGPLAPAALAALRARLGRA